MDIILIEKINLNTKQLLTVKELLKEVKYDFNELYIDKFYENIEQDKWIYIDNNMLKWIGYKSEELKENKRQYMNLLKEHFNQIKDYNIINNKEFNESISKCRLTPLNNISKTHNKTKHLIVSPDCFKLSLMLLRTNKSQEIREYYLEFEKIFKFYLQYQTKYQENKLLLEKKNQKQEKHNLLIEKFNDKPCIYVFEIKKNELIKIGSSNQLKNRQYGLRSDYKSKCILLDVFETKHYREIEHLILKDPNIKKNLYNNTINGINCREIIQLNDKFTYDRLIQIINSYIQQSINNNRNNILEKQNLENENKKLNIIEQLLKKNINPDIINNIKLNIVDNDIQIQIENIVNNLNEIKIEIKEIKENIINNKKEDYNSKENLKQYKYNQEELKIVDLEHIDFNIKERKSSGNKIQKIDQYNTKNVIKVYDNMITLLRSPECSGYYRKGIYNAISKNIMYRGFRWNFVEKDKDPYISNLEPTIINNKKIFKEPVIKLNKNKDNIINVYLSRKECATDIGIGVDKLRGIINNQKLYNDYYYILISQCSADIINQYNIKYANIKIPAINSKPIIQINPINNEKIVFDSINTIHIKLGFTEVSIRNAIKNKKLFHGCYWEYK